MVNEVPKIGYQDPFDIPIAGQEKSLETIGKKTVETKKKIEEETREDAFIMPKGLNIKLSPALHKDFKKFCIDKGMTAQEYVLEMIKKELKKESKNNK